MAFILCHKDILGLSDLDDSLAWAAGLKLERLFEHIFLDCTQ